MERPLDRPSAYGNCFPFNSEISPNNLNFMENWASIFIFLENFFVKNSDGKLTLNFDFF